jgi:hypothetical protein
MDAGSSAIKGLYLCKTAIHKLSARDRHADQPAEAERHAGRRQA